MTSRTYSVVVVPEQWVGEPGGLAERVAPIAGQPRRRLERALTRGPMTLESDLERGEAETLLDRLTTLEIPARIEDGSGEVVVEANASGAEGPSCSGAGRLAAALAASGEELGDRWIATEVQQGETGGGGEETPAAGSGGGPWEDVLETGEDRAAGSREGPQRARTDGDPAAGEQSVAGRESTERGRADRLEGDGRPDSEGAAGPGTGRTASESEGRGAGFDSAGLAEAIEESTSPGGASGGEGFDDRPEHAPGLAGLLSLIAPGAGQMYNGDSDRAWRDGYRAVLLVPWGRSVLNAYRRADEIRSGGRERPRPGAFWRALGYLFGWYGAVASLVVTAVLGARLIADSQGSPETLEAGVAAGGPAIERARLNVEGARIEASGAASEARNEPDGQFTVSDRERAVRLFEIGFEHCLAEDYDMCEASMKKVGRIEDAFRQPALELQAWASIQQNANVPSEPMPEMELEGTLAEIVDRAEGSSGGAEVTDARGGPSPAVDGR